MPKILSTSYKSRNKCWEYTKLLRSALSSKSPFYLWRMYFGEILEVVFHTLQLEVSKVLRVLVNCV